MRYLFARLGVILILATALAGSADAGGATRSNAGSETVFLSVGGMT
ncbi:MAG: hypothetical protein ACYTG6_08830 [Planctomycetota bacterium]|jgi:hypothetical protein